MLRVNSKTVKTFDVCGKKSVVSCINENVQRPTFNVQLSIAETVAAVCERRLCSAGGARRDKTIQHRASIILDSLTGLGMFARL